MPRDLAEISILAYEVAALFSLALERDDFERAGVWQELLLRQNDDDPSAAADA